MTFSTSDELKAEVAATRQGRRELPRWARTAVKHPVLTVFVVAFTIRLVAALVISVVVDGVFVPDESQYIDLAWYVASGRGAEAWLPGYGQSLFDSTFAFSGPLAGLFMLFGPHRLLGQVIAALFGAVTAALTTRLGLEVTTRRRALIAGLIVALLPSQIAWSAIVLRESMVWAGLAGVAVAFAIGAGQRRVAQLLGSVAAMVVAFWVLGSLRDQTFVAASWATAAAAFLFRPERAAIFRTLTVVASVVTPLALGLGLAGWSLVETAVPQLATIRTNMSIDAETSFAERTPVSSNEVEIRREQVLNFLVGHGIEEAVGRQVLEEIENEDSVDATDGAALLDAALRRLRERGETTLSLTEVKGEVHVYDDSASSTIGHLPRGVVATLLRPFPWETSGSLTSRIAAVENLLWYGLYVLAAIGAWSWRHARRQLALPILMLGMIVAVAAVTQGNLGTAFRHRGQILWAVAVLATLGAASRRGRLPERP